MAAAADVATILRHLYRSAFQREFYRRGWPERYRAVPDRKDQTDGWKTVGGANVFIRGGKIVAGCEGLKGEDVEDLIDEPEESRRERERRSDVAESHGIEGEELTPEQAKTLHEMPEGDVPHTGDPARITVSGRQMEVKHDDGVWFFRWVPLKEWVAASPQFAEAIQEHLGVTPVGGHENKPEHAGKGQEEVKEPKAEQQAEPDDRAARAARWRDLHRQHKEHEWIHIPAAQRAVQKAEDAIRAALRQQATYRDGADALRRHGAPESVAKAREYERAGNEIAGQLVEKLDPALKAAQAALIQAQEARNRVAAEKGQLGMRPQFNDLGFDLDSGRRLEGAELKAHQKAVTQEYKDRQRADKDKAREEAKAKREQERAAKAEERTARKAESQKPISINPKTRTGQAILATAEEYGVSPDDLADAAQFLYKDRAEIAQRREEAKAAARKLTGLTARDFNRLSNAGFDHTAARKVGGPTGERLAHFDEYAQEIAREFPDIGIGDPDDQRADLAAGLWKLLGEGAQPLPSITDPALLREAAQLVASSRDYDDTPMANYDEAVPFSRRGLIERYRRWRVREWVRRENNVRRVIERYQRLAASSTVNIPQTLAVSSSIIGTSTSRGCGSAILAQRSYHVSSSGARICPWP